MKLIQRLGLAVAAVLFYSMTASATSIIEHTVAASTSTFSPGQSLTTPLGGPWDDLTFNFFSNIAATTPSAAGTLFLLSQEYLGTPAALSAATPGYIAQSQSISGGIYIFNPLVTILPSTQYFVYATAAFGIVGQSIGTYPGGSLYSSFDSTDRFSNIVNQDLAFRLTGDAVVPSAVPEPASLLLIGTGIAALVVRRRRL